MELVKYEEARHALQVCATVDAAKDIMDKTAALAAYARQVNDKDMECWLAEMKMRAMRRVGELTSEIEKSPSGRESVSLPVAGKSKTEAIKRAGLTTSSVGRYEKLAKIPDDQFEDTIDAAKMRTESVTFASFERPEKIAETKAKRVDRIREIASQNAKLDTDKKYRVIYADPPWKYGDERTGLDGYTAAVDHYPTMSIKQMCDEIPVKEIAQGDAVLFMWVTSPLLYEAHPLIESWGFKYKACFVWDKVKHNVGHYNSARHEFLLICTRGSCTPDVKKLHDSVVELERSNKHSEKPEHFRELIDSMYPLGDRIELFRRGDAPEGWNVWGNQSE